MPRYVAFLRGINLGKRRLAMSRLASLFEELGCTKVETFIASGNVVFSAKGKNAGRLESRIAAHLKAELGYDVDTFLRTADEVKAIAAVDVLDEMVKHDGAINVGFWHERPQQAAVRKLAAVRTEVDEFRVIGREYYWYSRVGVAKSEVWRLPAVKALNLPDSTVRNMNTIRRLVAKCLM